MSKTIDERVVEMRFDNKQFESNIDTSLSSIDKLQKSLNMKGATKGLESVDNAAKKVNMTPLSSAVETVSMRFSALQIAGVTAMANITNSVVNTGKKMLSALTIDPIKTGFQEYETQINAVQTILANTEHEGTNLQQVNRALDDLNVYADKTIYKFAEMTKNIGTFTAAGVSLQTSVDSIKGIANLAAVSGSTSQQASTAMYQLSQALAAGKVSLMDWNSVVNAGMGGKVFQDALIRTSELLGTGAQQAINTYGSFRESLTQGEWLTTEVLTETLKQFAGAYSEADLIQQGFSEEQAKAIAQMAETAENAATKVKTFTQLWDTLKESAQSGWTQTWEILVGDFGEAKELLTEISDTVGGIIGKMSDARNTVLGEGLSTGWKQLLDSGIADEAGYIDSIQEVARKNGDAFDKMVEDSEEFTDALKKGLKDGTISSKTLSDAVHNLKEKMNGMSEEERKSAGYTSDMIAQIEELDKGLQDGSVSMEEFTDKILKPSGRENLIESLWNAAKGLMSVIKPIKEAFREIFPAITGEQVYSLTEWLRKLSENLILSDENAAKLKTTFSGLFAVAKTIADIFLTVAGFVFKIAGGFLSLGSVVLSFTSVLGSALTGFTEFVTTSDLFTKGIQGRMEQAGNAADALKNGISNAISSITEILTASHLAELFEAIWNAVKKLTNGIVEQLGNGLKRLIEVLNGANFDTFIDFLNTLAFGGIAVGVNKFFKNIREPIDGFVESINVLGDFKSGIKIVLDEVCGCFSAYQKKLQAGTLIKIAEAIAILAASLLVLSLIDSEKLATAVAAMAALFAELVISMKLFSGVGAKGMKKSISNIAVLTGMATAILILSGALRMIAGLDFKQMIVGITGIAGLMAIIVAYAKVMGDSKVIAKGATQMVIFAAAVKILASVCKDLSELSIEELAKGLGSVAILLASVAGFLKLAEFGNKAKLTAVGIIALAAAMKILASACKDFGALEWTEIGKAFASIGSLLAMISAFNIISGLAKNVATTGVSLIAIGAAMKIFASVFEDFGALDGEEIKKSLISIGASLLILAVALNAMRGTLSGSVALTVAVSALTLLTAVLVTLGSLGWESIIKSLITLAGTFTILGVAGTVLSPLLPVIIGLGVSLAVVSAAVIGLGAGLVLVGVGLTAIAAGFTALAVAVAAGATSITAALAVVITGIISLIPSIAVSIGEGIIAFCKVIAEGAKTIGETIKALILTIMDVLVECVPSIVDGLFKLVTACLDSLVEYAPRIISDIYQFIALLIEGLADYMPKLINAIVDVFKALFDGVINAIEEIDVDELAEVVKSFGILTAIMVALGALTSLIPSAMAGVLGMGVLIAELALVLAAVGALSQIPGLNWLIGEGGKLLQNLGTAIGQFVGGIVGGFMSGVSSQFPKIAEDLSSFMTKIQPFIQGAGNISASMFDGVQALTKSIMLLTAADLFNGISKWITGDNSMTAFAEELVPFGKAMKQYSDEVSGMDPNVVEASANAAEALSKLAKGLPNEGGLAGLFAGDNDISEFGEKIASFGSSLAKYYSSISVIDMTKLALATTEFSNLVNLIKGMANIDVSGANNFASSLESIGNSGVDKFVSAFTGATDKIKEAANSMLNAFTSAVNMQKANLNTTIMSLMNSIITAFTGKYYRFTEVGKTLMTKILTGVKSQQQTVKSAFIQVTALTLSALRSNYTGFYNVGAYLVKGVANGISANTYMAVAKARAMALAAAQAAKVALKINSPSKVGYEIGGFFGQGFVNSIADYTDKSYEAGTGMASSAKEGLKNAVSKISDFIEGGIDSQPTIRPLLDLSDVSSGANKLSSILSGSQAMKINAGFGGNSGSSIQNESSAKASSAGNTYTFTQNNYSPKALSRIDIYRQTKNQFSALKGLV